jgi:FkbM family methyltransferase
MWNLKRSVVRRLFGKIGIDRHSPSYQVLQKVKIKWLNKSFVKSYSQAAEDLIIQRLMGNASATGSYLDIGSGMPKSGSNTYLFYKLGWSGIVIDPIQTNIRATQRARPRDIIIQACVANKMGETTFYEFIPYQVSTLSETARDEALSSGAILKRAMRIPVITVASLELQVSQAEPFFMSIDVEGSEMEVLEGIDWSFFRPRVICIEDWRNTGRNQQTPISNYLERYGYDRVAHVCPSSFFVARES